MGVPRRERRTHGPQGPAAVRQRGAVHAALCPHPRPSLLRGNCCQLRSEDTDFRGRVLWMSRTWRDRPEGCAGVGGLGEGGGKGWCAHGRRAGRREEGDTPHPPTPLLLVLRLPDPLDCSELTQAPLAPASLPVSSPPRTLWAQSTGVGLGPRHLESQADSPQQCAPSPRPAPRPRGQLEPTLLKCLPTKLPSCVFNLLLK